MSDTSDDDVIFLGYEQVPAGLSLVPAYESSDDDNDTEAYTENDKTGFDVEQWGWGNIEQGDQNNQEEIGHEEEKDELEKPVLEQFAFVDGLERLKHPYFDVFENVSVPYSEEQLNIMEISPLKLLLETPCHLVDTIREFENMLGKLQTASEIGLEIELDFSAFQPTLCLVEVSTRDCDYIIDAVALREQLPLLGMVFYDHNILKIFYRAENILYFFQQELGLYFVNIFDIQKAHMCIKESDPDNPESLDTILQTEYSWDSRSHMIRPVEQPYLTFKKRPLETNVKLYCQLGSHFLIHIYQQIRNQLLVCEKRVYMEYLDKCNSLCKYQYINPQHDSFISAIKDLTGYHSWQTETLTALNNARFRLAMAANKNPDRFLDLPALKKLAWTMPQRQEAIEMMARSPFVNCFDPPVKQVIAEKMVGHPGMKQLFEIRAIEGQLPNAEKGPLRSELTRQRNTLIRSAALIELNFNKASLLGETLKIMNDLHRMDVGEEEVARETSVQPPSPSPPPAVSKESIESEKTCEEAGDDDVDEIEVERGCISDYGKIQCDPFAVVSNLERLSHPYFDLNATVPVSQDQVLPAWISDPKPNVDDVECHVVNTESDLVTLIEVLEGETEIGVGVEVDDAGFEPRLLCVTISTRDADYILDASALSKQDFQTLTRVFYESKILKVMFRAEVVLYWLQQVLALYCVNVLDLHKAAQWQETRPTAYSLDRKLKKTYKVCRQISGMSVGDMAKSEDNAHLYRRYCRLGTHYLLDMYHTMKNKILMKIGITSFSELLTKCNDMCKLKYPAPRQFEARLLAKDMRLFHRAQSRTLEFVHRWRDAVAREQDEKPDAVLADHRLEQLVVDMPNTENRVKKTCRSKYVDRDYRKVDKLLGMARLGINYHGVHLMKTLRKVRSKAKPKRKDAKETTAIAAATAGAASTADAPPPRPQGVPLPKKPKSKAKLKKKNAKKKTATTAAAGGLRTINHQDIYPSPSANAAPTSYTPPPQPQQQDGAANCKKVQIVPPTRRDNLTPGCHGDKDADISGNNSSGGSREMAPPYGPHPPPHLYDRPPLPHPMAVGYQHEGQFGARRFPDDQWTAGYRYGPAGPRFGPRGRRGHYGTAGFKKIW